MTHVMFLLALSLCCIFLSLTGLSPPLSIFCQKHKSSLIQYTKQAIPLPPDLSLSYEIASQPP